MSTDPDRQPLPILYSFRRCPYAIRARLAIRAAGVSVALREVVLRDKPAAFVATSPKATVPVLLLPEGRVLEQSLEIMRWALGQHDPQGWLPSDTHAEAHPGAPTDAEALIALNDGPFKQALDRYKYAPRGPMPNGTAKCDEAVALMLAPLNERLASHRFLLRDTPSLADMAIVPFVRQFAAVDAVGFDRLPLALLRGWLRRLTGTPLFESVMPKFAPWRPGDAVTVF